MKKASITWEAIVKLIIILIVFIILIVLSFIFKERLYELFQGIVSSLRYGGF